MNQKLKVIAEKDSELRQILESYATNQASAQPRILQDLTDKTEKYELMI